MWIYIKKEYWPEYSIPLNKNLVLVAKKIEILLQMLYTGWWVTIFKCPCSELFWSAFSRIRTEYRKIRIAAFHTRETGN